LFFIHLAHSVEFGIFQFRPWFRAESPCRLFFEDPDQFAQLSPKELPPLMEISFLMVGKRYNLLQINNTDATVVTQLP
jgi:hypothetical protein